MAMKNLVLLIFAILMTGSYSGYGQSSNKGTSGTVSKKVEAYYFHFTMRCETCRSVEAQAKADLESLYPGNISFRAINLDDASGKTIAEKLRVSGQTLLIVRVDHQINLTNEGFMYARSNPAKFKSILKERVDALIKL